jgi:O-acetyl-ADP-ribose deacetylase (regulator of RNase III)
MSNIHYRRGDIFEANAQVIVNPVNCEGIMGKGLALEFKKRYPDMFSAYQHDCKTGRLRIGRPTLYSKSEPWILNFPTKNTWRANSKLEYLEKGLEYFITNYKEAGITSISFPKLGAQNGKLPWDEVGPIMARYLSQADIDVYIYIAEGDQEFFVDTHQEEAAWKQFSELALSLDRLKGEINLSAREAKKVHEARQTREFTTIADIEKINAAKVSLQRIKDYIQSQIYHKHELPGMPDKKASAKPKGKKQTRKVVRQKHRQADDSQASHAVKALSLF